MLCEDHIYPVPEPWGLIILILNCCAPGLGTQVQSYYAAEGCNCGTYCVGILQALSAPFLVGIVWSIWHGCKVYEVSATANRPVQKVVVTQQHVVYG